MMNDKRMWSRRQAHGARSSSRIWPPPPPRPQTRQTRTRLSLSRVPRFHQVPYLRPSQRTSSWVEEQHTKDNPTMPEKPPFPGRPAQPPGPTFLQYSPDGLRLIVAGVGNFARSFRTGDHNEPDLLPSTHQETFAVASGVWTVCDSTTGNHLLTVFRMTT